ncbi:NUDIX hydrolase [Streptomyces sp. NPDC048200]|uniref:NUDIX hydrolase n=1 Tax=Streptomyces sp. NPDC048200 TaxID=3365512 RepID=UPI0037138844
MPGVVEPDDPQAGVSGDPRERAIDVARLGRPYANTTRGIVSLGFRCKPSGGTGRTSSQSTTVDWLTRKEASERMAEVFAIQPLDALDALDALDGNGLHVRSQDGNELSRR